MSLSKFVKGLAANKAHDALTDARNVSASMDRLLPAEQNSPADSGERFFVVEYRPKGYKTAILRTQPVPLVEALEVAVSFVDTKPTDYLDEPEKHRAGYLPASVRIIDPEFHETFAYLRACGEDLKLVHRVNSTSPALINASGYSTPFIDPTYRYVHELTNSGKFSDSVENESFVSVDGEFAVFYRWNGMYPGHVSH